MLLYPLRVYERHKQASFAGDRHHSSQESPGEMKKAKSRQDLQKMRQTTLRQLRQEEKARQNLKVRAATRRHALIVLRIQTRRFHKFR